MEENGKKKHWNGSKNSQKGKDLANDQLQGDQRRCKVTCEYCNYQKMPMGSQAIGKKPPQSPIVVKTTCAEEVTICRNGATFCGLIKVRLFFLGVGAADSLSDEPQILELWSGQPNPRTFIQ